MIRVSIIDSGKMLENTLCNALNEYSNVAFAVAWATDNSNFFRELTKSEDNLKKIKFSTVGIHFYQTSPGVLNFFKKSEYLHIILQRSGVFHPKIYLFWNDMVNNIEYTLIVGSANLTYSAFNQNSEVSVQIISDKEERFNQVLSILKGYFENGSEISNDICRIYNIKYHLMKKESINLNDEEGCKIVNILSYSKNEFLQVSWGEYFTLVKNDYHQSIERRCKVLRTAQEYFKNFENLMKMDTICRKCIAGTSGKNENDNIDFGWFGGMTGSGRFRAIINGNKNYIDSLKIISNALDNIPLSGDITFDNYMNYIKPVIKINGIGIGCATRLLAMKRPDYFVCLDNPNTKKLCTALEIKYAFFTDKFKEDPGAYWNLIIKPIIENAQWWRNNNNLTDIELQVWNCRMAMLDAIFFDPS